MSVFPNHTAALIPDSETRRTVLTAVFAAIILLNLILIVDIMTRKSASPALQTA